MCAAHLKDASPDMRFADDSDRATALEEAEREYMVQQAREAAKHRHLVPVGTCYYCGEDVRKPKVFCDHDCAAGYDQLLAARRRNGEG